VNKRLASCRGFNLSSTGKKIVPENVKCLIAVGIFWGCAISLQNIKERTALFLSKNTNQHVSKVFSPAG
jgi:hypothetical protein